MIVNLIRIIFILVGVVFLILGLKKFFNIGINKKK